MLKYLHVVSVSGGKDSTAMYCWAIEQFGQDFVPIFADTGHEHPVTTNYLRNLAQIAGGPEIVWVKADFRARLETKFTKEKARSESSQGLIDRNREWMSSTGFSSGNAFLDMMILKGRAPSTRAQFCTEELKMKPIKAYVDSIRGDKELVNYVGIRAGESYRRSKLPEQDWNEFFDCLVKRPILRWSEEEVFAYLRKKGVPPNPLYAVGYSRVGCFPCVHANKRELARLPEWAWERLANWERVLGRSWFAPGLIPEPGIPTIEQVRAWSKTKWGGKEVDPDASEEKDVPSCMSTWGQCE